MKLPQLLKRKKLRATTARRGLDPTEMDFEEMSEPNMKLSRALLIVLVLHVVAVAGIIAFNTIKTRQLPPPMVSNESVSAAVKTKAAPASTMKSEEPAPVVPVRNEESKIIKAPKAIAMEEQKPERAKTADTSATKPDSSKIYIVAKGDNPVSIARKLKVPYDELMAANHITDPHKLQIGQKLIIPVKSAKAKKAD